MENQIEQKQEFSKLIFYKEVYSFEFTEIIGDMKINDCINQEIRDKKLKKLGKRLFRKFRNRRKRNKRKSIFNICLDKELRMLSQKEIDSLLTEDIDSILLTKKGEKPAKIKRIKFHDWFLKIYIKGKEYKYLLPFQGE